MITENFDFDWAKAEQEYRRAIELNPSYATAHQWYAEYLALQGRFDGALAESERARALDPLSRIIAADKGAILYYARRYDEAIAQFRGVREKEPDFPRAQMMVSALVEKGQFATALAEFEKSDDRRSEAWTWAWRAYVYGRTGQHARAQHAIERVKQSYKLRPTNPDPMLWALLGAGDRNETFAWFEKAFADHSNLLTTLRVNPRSIRCATIHVLRTLCGGCDLLRNRGRVKISGGSCLIEMQIPCGGGPPPHRCDLFSPAFDFRNGNFS